MPHPAHLRRPPPLVIGGRSFPLGDRTYVVGVVNVTPDSFSDGGAHLDPDAAAARAVALAEAGADLVEVGGESTRPGAEAVPAEIELRRVLPVLERLAGRLDRPIAIDTTKGEVARRALAAGASLVNDISGLTFDGGVGEAAAEAGAPIVLMHTLGPPRTMQRDVRYEGDVVEAVRASLARAIARATALGVAGEGTIVDPGFGFGKLLGHNVALLARLSEIAELGRPVLVGLSRKSFLGQLTGIEVPAARTVASAAAAAIAALGGASFVRAHDVRETREALSVADAAFAERVVAARRE